MDKKRLWQEVTICDDFMFQHVMQNKDICKRFLELLLKKQLADIRYPQVEKSLKLKRKSKSVRLDVYVTDTKGNKYDVEMQTTDYPSDVLAKRTRYYQSMIDMNVLKRGRHYDDLKESYVIFICTFDPFDQHRRIYTFKNDCQEDKELGLGDGTYKIFLNCNGYGDEIDEDLADFLELLKGQKPKRKFAKDVEEEFKKLCNSKELEVEYMTYAQRLYEEKKKGREEGMVKGREEGMAKGREEGMAKGREEGMAKGREEGMAIGEARGRAEGEVIGRIAAMVVGVRNMMKKLKMSADEAMDMFSVSIADRPAVLAAL